MNKNEPRHFKILSMDGLGQGVSKEADQITFIPKTLPGESGLAQIQAKKKGVSFGKLHGLEERSPLRINPACPHFDQCSGCHYLHTTYEEELKFKLQHLTRLLSRFDSPAITVTAATERLGYRNRLQLHYDLDQNQLGLLATKSQQIVPIPDCKIAVPEVQTKVQHLYQQQNWKKLLGPKAPKQGHLEIYQKSDGLSVQVNRPYAEGGFTQVNEKMNQALKGILEKHHQAFPSKGLLELFAGNGNLSENLNYSERLCFDYYSQTVSHPFYSLNLYHPQALKQVEKVVKEQDGFNPSWLMLDPPRSGMAHLATWVEAFSPELVSYISCDPQTLVRDLHQIKNYQILGAHLVDFFPGTFHFETMIFLKRK